MFSVILDMDGTLLDTQRICVPAWEFAGRNQGVTGVGDCIVQVCGMNENGWSAYLKEHFPTLDVDIFKKDMREYIISNGKVVFKEGGRQLLDFLKEHNIKTALASGSSRGSIDHHLAEVKAAHYFDFIVSGKDVENGKPAPDVFLRAAQLLGVSPQDCFVIEDSANGIKAGYSAGMKCIGVPDIVPFDEETKKLTVACATTLNDVITILKGYM